MNDESKKNRSYPLRPHPRVTLAIVKAEAALDDAIRAWEEVERAEAACAKEEMDGVLGATGDLDENDLIPLYFAQRGVGSAGVVVRMLRAFRGRES